MSYGLIYIIPFASFKNEVCVIEIEKEDYAGETTELIPAESPFSVDIEDDDFMYVATRFSTGKICVVGSDYLRHLYSTAYQQYRVTFKRNNVVTWCGFIKPELYTQDYSSKLFELELECQSAMSTLEFILYKQIGEEGKVFVSLWTLLKNAITLSNAKYNSIVFPHVYSETESDYLSESDIDNVLKKMTLSEQNFFDEDDKAMTYKEVLEEICKFLNWTCVDWKGDLYFIDVDHQGDYWKYSLDMKSWETIHLLGLLNVQNVGFAGSDHSLDLVPGYNKVTVKTSTYSVGVLTPDEDYDDLSVAVIPSDVTQNNKVSHKIVLLPGMWDMRQYKEDQTGEGVEAVTLEWVKENKDKANMLMGALPIQFCEYDLKEDGKGGLVPSITSYNYEDGIQVRWTTKDPPQYLSSAMDMRPVILIKGASATYSDGAFGITGQLRRCLNKEMGVIGGKRKWYATPKLMCSLKIGNRRYNGTKWTDNPFAYFYLEFQNTDSEVDWFNMKDTKVLEMPYNGLAGYVIPINEILTGELELVIYSSYTYVFGAETNLHEFGFFLKGLKFIYQEADFTDTAKGNSDRYYENVLNEDYINELDEIEFKISSYNNDGACYSKVMLGDKYLEDNLYSAIEEKMIRPEEQLIRRIINRYSDTHIKLTQEIQEVPELTPITRLSDDFMVGKVFINTGGTIDYKQGKFRCIMIEV